MTQDEIETQPPPLHLDGSPEFDLDPAAAWPVPKSKPVEPQSQIARITEPLRRWIERVAS